MRVVGVALSLAVVTGLAAWLTSAEARNSANDIRATQSYLHAQVAFYETVLADSRVGVAAAEGFAEKVARECPRVAVSAPRDSALRGELVLETSEAMRLAYFSPVRTALQDLVSTVSHLRWSERGLTLIVDIDAARNPLATAPVPDLCRDWRAWVTSGYKEISSGTTQFLAKLAPVLAGSNGPGLERDPAIESAIEADLRPYEGPGGRRLQRRVDHRRRLVRLQVSSALPALFRKIEAALGLRAGALYESGPALPIEPPEDVIRSDGERLVEFDLGRAVVAQTGCLACHRIGESGNAGPGPDLTHVGAKLSGAGIARVLANPEPPMPSFRRLPTQKFNAVVEFLALLH